MPTEAEIQRIIELYDNGNGLSQGQIAKELNRSKSYINGIIHSVGAVVGVRERSRTKNATDAHVEYCLKKRINLIDRGMEKLDTMLDSIDKPSGMKDWFVAVGIAIDKRRLEQPNGTSKSGLADIREHLKEAREKKENVGNVSPGLQSG